VSLSVERLQRQDSAPAGTVERRTGLSYSEFLQNYLYPRRPVTLTDATKQWPAMSRWTLDFLASRYGAKDVPVTVGRKTHTINFARFIAYLKLQEHAATQDEPLYLRNIHVSDEFPELLGDFTIPEYFRPNWLGRWPLNKFVPDAWSSWAELFIGPAGARFPFVHFDTAMTHAWLSQVCGRKQFWIVPPSQSAFLYPEEKSQNYSPVQDLRCPDLERFPLLAKAQIATCVLEPGDTLFIPAGWWHTAECLTISITVAGNFVNDSNFRDFRRAIVLPKFRGRPWPARLLNQGLLRFHGFTSRLADWKDQLKSKLKSN
jgi:histone arginine demethylase JMJD6